MSNLYGQDNLQTVVIDDFSPGVMNYGLSSLSPIYSSVAPPGSASFAVRCVNKPGIGLTPFASYSILPDEQGFVLPVECNSGSMATMGNYQSSEPTTLDELIYAATTVIGTNLAYVWVWAGLGGAGSPGPFNLDFTAELVNVTPFFSATRITYESISTAPLPTMFFTYSGTIAFTPPYDGTEGGATSNSLVRTVTNDASYDNIEDYLGLTTYTDRVVAFAVTESGPTGYIAGDKIVNNNLIIYTDPPEGPALPIPEATTIFAVENPQDICAWGSQSTGELFLCFRGAGAVAVSGDIADPSSAIYLPAVTGTGGIFQQAVSTPVGLVYVTQSQGVQAWNGGNSSLKLSQNIPDDACIRSDSFSFHALSNNYLFFANNWVYDCINNSWWQAEDPGVINFGSFVGSSIYGEIMYALPYVLPVTPAAVYAYVFNFDNHASNYEWISNPITPSAGALASLQYVEICASNSSDTAATIIVTPTIPPGQTPSPLNQNPTQSQTFTIPATTTAYRASLPFGFTDYNIEVGIVATGSPAPVLHSLTLGFSPQRTTTIR